MAHIFIFSTVNSFCTLKNPDNPFRKSEFKTIEAVINMAVSIIENNGDARIAAKALKVLSENVSKLSEAAVDSRRGNNTEGFTFTYEEETDPEIFFVPYVWELIVCVVTSSMLEWNKERILVFPLLEADDVPDDITLSDASSSVTPSAQQYSIDVATVV
jgi:hypothetical protein